MIHKNLVHVLSEALKFDDSNFSINCLEICGYLLEANLYVTQSVDDRIKIVDMFRETDCLSKIEYLANDMNEEISAFAHNIIDRFFENSNQNEYISEEEN